MRLLLCEILGYSHTRKNGARDFQIQSNPRMRPPSQNTKNVLSQSLILEPLVNDLLPQATPTTISADSFRIFYCFQPPVSDHLTYGLTKQ